jgi:MazG family protein
VRDLDALPPDDPRLLGVRQILWVMDQLRGPEGCPWDKEQTHASLRGYLLEETYELLEAMESGRSQDVCEELGDLLFQVVFHARIAEDEGRYSIHDVGQGIATKLHRRHPHVFDPEYVIEDARQVERAWQEFKKQEGRTSILDGLPRQFPALLRAQRLQEKVAAVGFDWPDARGPRAKIDEELAELDAEIEGGDSARIAAELGDLLFSVVNLARHLGVDAEAALRESAATFEGRFRHVESLGGELHSLGADELERRWEAAKGAEREKKPPTE